MKRILVIQTAFLGDVVLATAVVEKLAAQFPDAALELLVRKGSEGLVANNPHLQEVLVWDKTSGKYRNLFKLLRHIRRRKYDAVITLQRYASSGLLCGFSKANIRAGFANNPLSWRFTHRTEHEISQEPGGPHEVDRNQAVIAFLTDAEPQQPKIYPSAEDWAKASSMANGTYVCLAPSSVWFTKRWPGVYWEQVMDALPQVQFYLMGAPGERKELDALRGGRPNVSNLAGACSLLQSAAVMRGARMNIVNDSGPLHLCSAVDAPVTAIFCNTVPEFGFGPLGSDVEVVQTEESLPCRPCGLTGKKECPLGHFRCGHSISVNRVIARITSKL